MATHSFLIRTDSEKLAQLDELGQKLDRSRDALVNQAIDDFLLQQAIILGKIKRGLESADRGELIPHQQVFDRLKSRSLTLGTSRDDLESP